MIPNIQKEGMLKVGTTLANGKYRIDQYLASGGFGNTYAATDTTFEEKVAIKELYIKGVCGRSTDSQNISISLTENQMSFDAQREKFRKEARRLRKLTNPHIVKVHDLFDENGTSYYVMDFVEGESLSARMKRTGRPMNETELMTIVPQVLDALECVHFAGIWHLDLKPANIMIDAKGNVQLIDFGASKQLHNANGDSLSTSSVMAYTAGYASSEQMEQNMEKFGPWTDLYSLGATMYNLLTHQTPPLPSDIADEGSDALKFPQDISKKTKELILWLMKPNRKMRPQSVADVKQFLAEETEKLCVIEDTLAKTQDTGIEETISVHKEETDQEAKKTESKEINPVNENLPTTKKSFNIMKIVVPVVLFLCLGCGVYFYINHFNGDAIQNPKMVYVQDREIKIEAGPDNLRSYKFTGEIADVEGSLPNGSGIAKFDQYGDIPSAIYSGCFKEGVCDDNTGNATLIFASGDKYVGTFLDGCYDEGTYTLADGSYFTGSFYDGNPYNGKWYNADGSLSANVKDGKEE